MPPIHYTVEVVTAPVLDDDWSRFEDAIDMLSGSLYADPIEPTLYFSLEADQEYPYMCTNISEVGILMGLLGIHPIKICVAIADRVDFDYAEEDYEPSLA